MTLRILLVDREGSSLAALRRAVREAGLMEARIDRCDNVQTAVGRLVEEPYDLALVATRAGNPALTQALFPLLCAAPGCTVLPLELGGEAEIGVVDGGWLARTLSCLARHRRDQRRLVYWATHDRLTGLANRWLLEEKVRDAVARARRRGCSGALLFIDLDGFKGVNDCFGHDAGDVVLRATAARLRAALRECDIVARFGGDEFVVLLDSPQQEHTARAVARKLRQRISEPVQLPHGAIRVSCSIGVALFPDQGEDLEALLRYADRLMYRSKNAGRLAAVG